VTDVSEENITSIFRVKNPRSRKKREQVAGSSFADFSTLKMEEILSSEMSVHARSTQRHIREDGILHSHRWENLKSYRPCSVHKSNYLFEINMFVDVRHEEFSDITLSRF
jgi:hypothetical protein